ncbi:membrane protein FAM174A [Suncus etruscus]|uniref:membrane protein FAM174A n=1 Tax=Suncus etruscus TaxID=109475 RepID=UPI00210F3BB5|nr:membrane protein FAM174A [Suncus etruscus]
MPAPRCRSGRPPVLLLLPLLLLLLLPGWPGPRAAEASPEPGPGPAESAPRTLPPLPPGPTAARPPGSVAAGANGSSPVEEGALGGGLAVSPNPADKPMTQRALTVLMVVSGAVLVYFVVRTVRMRRRNRKTRRYGVLDTNIENMELTPLEQDDDEEDNTLFDANHPRR